MSIYRSLGAEKFPLIEQTYYPNHKEMVRANNKHKFLFLLHLKEFILSVYHPLVLAVVTLVLWNKDVYSYKILYSLTMGKTFLVFLKFQRLKWEIFFFLKYIHFRLLRLRVKLCSLFFVNWIIVWNVDLYILLMRGFCAILLNSEKLENSVNNFENIRLSLTTISVSFSNISCSI